jgi:hypothetical protein
MDIEMKHATRYCETERGNILFMILIAVALIGLLTAVMMNSGGGESANIDEETLVIRVSEAQRAASEFERGVMFIVNSGKSEADLRFAHPDAPSSYGDLSADLDPTDQLFHLRGGGASYKEAPEDINDGSKWEVYGGTAVPGMGSARAELVAVLPNVTQQFCEKLNQMAGQDAPDDTGGSLASGALPGNCVSMGPNGRFRDAQQFYATPNMMDESSFAQDPETNGPRPAQDACVLCAADGNYHYYHVLMAR